MTKERLRVHYKMGKEVLKQHGIKVVLYPLKDKQYTLDKGTLTISDSLEPRQMTDIVNYLATTVVYKSITPKEEPAPKKQKPLMSFHSSIANEKLYIRAVSEEQAVVLLRRRLLGKIGKFDASLTVDNAHNVITREEVK